MVQNMVKKNIRMYKELFIDVFGFVIIEYVKSQRQS